MQKVESVMSTFVYKKIFSFQCASIQIMPGLEGDLEEWQTQEVNVTRGEADSSTFSCTY